MKITDWPESDRPREKLLTNGPAILSDAEVLAVLLRTGIKGYSALDVARTLINKFGNLGAIIAANSEQVMQLPGIGAAKYGQILCAIELARRCAGCALRQTDVYSDVDSAMSYVQQQMRFLTQEVFGMLLLDSQHQLIAFRKMFYGTINSAAVYPRELVKCALADNAAAVILAHNHPSGVAEPSAADIAITQQIKQAMALMEIRVLDHFVVGDITTVSLAQRGLI